LAARGHNRVVSGRPPLRSGAVSTPAPPSGNIVFSFRFMSCDDNMFGVSKCKEVWLHELFTKLRDYSTWDAGEFRSKGAKGLRAHEVNWASTSRPAGFEFKNQQLNDIPGYQFAVSKTKGRVVGFWLDAVFNVVWLDPDHLLY
jgi:hypothetical protein